MLCFSNLEFFNYPLIVLYLIIFLFNQPENCCSSYNLLLFFFYLIISTHIFQLLMWARHSSREREDSYEQYGLVLHPHRTYQMWPFLLNKSCLPLSHSCEVLLLKSGVILWPTLTNTMQRKSCYASVGPRLRRLGDSVTVPWERYLQALTTLEPSCHRKDMPATWRDHVSEDILDMDIQLVSPK